MKVKSFFNSSEFIWHAFVLLVLIGSFSTQWRGLLGGGNQLEGNLLERYLLIFIYGVSIATLVFYIPNLINLFTRSFLLWTLVLLALISFSWSALPNITLRRAISSLLATLYAAVLFFRFKPEKLMDLLFSVFIIIISSSLFMVAFFPEVGMMGGTHLGSWRGVMSHKNSFGFVCLIAIMIFYYKFLRSRGIKQIFILFLLMIALIMLVKSNSTTAYVLLAILFFSAWMINLAGRLQKDWPIFLIFVMGTFLIAFLILASEYTSILNLLGKDVTLTGRLPLWQNIIPYGMNKFWFGYGYRVFWVDPSGPYPAIWSEVSWKPLHAHNGYIDLWLNLGFVGLIVVMILLFELFTISFKLIMKMKNIKFYQFSFIHFILFFTILVFFDSFTESVILKSDINNAFYWIMICYAYFYVKTNILRKKMTIEVSKTEHHHLSK